MSHQTRREFLEQSMLAAAAAAAAGGIVMQPARSFGAAGANEKIGIAVIGVNGRGGEHINGYLGLPDQCEIVAICDADENVGMAKGVEKVKSKTGKAPKFYQDIRLLLEDKNVHAVSIATPNHWHALGAIWAMQAGKDVYVEKPVSHNVSEGRRIVDAARKYKKICQAGTQSRAASGTQELMKFLHSGGLGNITLARGLCYKTRKPIGPKGEYPVPAGVDFDLWCGPAPKHAVTRPKFHYDWHWQFDYGNGDLGNQGIHQVDLARWALGEKGLSNSIVSYGGRYGQPDAGDTANSQVAIFDYGPKTLVFEVRGMETGEYAPPKVAQGKGAKIGVVIEGTKGYAVMSNYNGGTIFDKNGVEGQTFKGTGNHFENFLQAVRSRNVEKQFADIEEGHVSSALCHLANISYRLGQKQAPAFVRQQLAGCKVNDHCQETFDRFAENLTGGKNKVDLQKDLVTFGAQLVVDPKTETFVGANAAAANPMLSRESRKGFEVPTSADKV